MADDECPVCRFINNTHWAWCPERKRDMAERDDDLPARVHKRLSYISYATDVRPVLAQAWTQLMRLSIDHLQAYETDLYYDAVWLEENVKGEDFTFWYSFDDCGTTISHAEDFEGHRRYKYQCRMWLDKGSLLFAATKVER